MSKQGQNKTPVNPFVAESIEQHAEQVADITTRMAEPLAPEPEAEAVVVEDAKIGEPVDLGAADAIAEATADALSDADAFSDEALEAALAQATAADTSADTPGPVVEPDAALTSGNEPAEADIPADIPEDTPAEPEAIVTPGGAVIPPPFDSPAEIEPPDPDDVIRASRAYGDLLERGYQDREALAELKARAEAAQ